MTDGASGCRRVVLGHIAGPSGTRGWVRIQSSTDPPENILRYAPWLVEREGNWRRVGVVEQRTAGSRVFVRLEGCHHRDQAGDYRGCEIAVERSRFPSPDDDEYYWTDLVGMRVISTDGTELGRIERMMGTGANDVMVVTGTIERLIPFLTGTVVRSVDLDRGCIVVDWHPDD